MLSTPVDVYLAWARVLSIILAVAPKEERRGGDSATGRGWVNAHPCCNLSQMSKGRDASVISAGHHWEVGSASRSLDLVVGYDSVPQLKIRI